MKLPKNKSVTIAIAISVVISLWLLSGLFSSNDDIASTKNTTSLGSNNLVKVQTQTQDAQDHVNIIRLYGHTAPDRDVEIKAETSGHIAEVLIEKGTYLHKGDVIARIAMDDRTSQLKSAQALLKQRQLEFEASRKLSQKSFRSQTKLAEAEALLQSAKANLETRRLDVSNTQIKAPFDGKLEERAIEVGDYVTSGTLLARIIDLSPIVVNVDISENDISKIRDGQPALALLNDGREINGIVRFVAQTSSTATRTYKIEIEGENPNNSIPSGLTAQVSLKIGTQKAFRLSPAILTLSDAGIVGVKSVDSQDIVRFHPIELLEDTPEGIWVSGLPKQIRIITRGQEYVSIGQTVKPIELEQTHVVTDAQGNAQ